MHPKDIDAHLTSEDREQLTRGKPTPAGTPAAPEHQHPQREPVAARVKRLLLGDTTPEMRKLHTASD